MTKQRTTNSRNLFSYCNFKFFRHGFGCRKKVKAMSVETLVEVLRGKKLVMFDKWLLSVAVTDSRGAVWGQA